MRTYSSVHAWKNLWTEKPVGHRITKIWTRLSDEAQENFQLLKKNVFHKFMYGI